MAPYCSKCQPPATGSGGLLTFGKTGTYSGCEEWMISHSHRSIANLMHMAETFVLHKIKK